MIAYRGKVIQIGEKQFNIEPEVFNQYVNKHTKKETSNCFFYKRHKKKLVFKNNIRCEYVIDNLKANVAFWKFNIFGENQEAVEFKKKDLNKFLQWSNIVKTN